MKIFTLVLICLTSLTGLTQTSWNLSESGVPTGYSPNDFALAANGDVYVGASKYNGTVFIPKLLKSTNSGGLWSEITMSGLDSVQNVNAIIFSGSTLLLAGSNSTHGSYYVYSSTDNGQTWLLSNTGIPSGYSPNDFSLAPNGDVYLVASQYNGTSFVPKLLKSTNGGGSWAEITMSGLTNVQNTNAITFIGNNLLLSGSGGGSYYVYVSTDNGQTWQSSNSGIPTGYSVNDFAITPGQKLYAACSQWNGATFTPKIIESSNSGASWTEITGLTGLTNLQNTNTIIYSDGVLLLGGSNSSTPTYFIFSSTISATNIDIQNENNSYSLFPNPSEDRFYLKGQFGEQAFLKIKNAMGQTLFEKPIASGEQVNTSYWAAGVYFAVVIVNGKEQEVIKVIKN